VSAFEGNASVSEIINHGRWQATLQRSLEHNFTNARNRIKHYVISHPFEFPNQIQIRRTPSLKGVTHIFESWDNHYVVSSAIIFVNPLITTEDPIVTIGTNSTRNDTPAVFVNWWRLPRYTPNAVEDHLLYQSLDTSQSSQPLVNLITALDEFFLYNQEALLGPLSSLPSLHPPRYNCVPYIAFEHTSITDFNPLNPTSQTYTNPPESQ
jgi:hypothetical protein